MHEIVRKELLERFHFDGSVEFEGRDIACIHPSPWYANDCAFQLDVSRKKLGKIDALKELRAYLIEMTEAGVMSRQEAVSMLPPLLLDVRPTDVVLDMCAAPGSKTLQVLERVNGQEGLVIANDADYRRAYMLVNQTSHLPSTNLVVTSHPGQSFPAIPQVDKVVCDVPCSGDGTLVPAWRETEG